MYISAEDFANTDLVPRLAVNAKVSPMLAKRRKHDIQAPEGLVHEVVDLYHPCYDWKSPDPAGTVIAVHVFTPTDVPVRAALLFLHGMNEYGCRYTHVYERLCKAGVAVVAPDQPGCGHSDGPAGRTHHVREWVATAVLAHGVRARLFPNVPYFLFGHSLGGLTAFHTAQAFPETCTAGLVLSAPAIEIERTSLPGPLRRVLKSLPAGMRRSLAAPGLSDKNVCENVVPGLAPLSHPLVTKLVNLQTTCAMAMAGEAACGQIDRHYAATHACGCQCSELPAADGAFVCQCLTPCKAVWKRQNRGLEPVPHAEHARTDVDDAPFLRLAPRLCILHGSSDRLCDWRRAHKMALATGHPDWTRDLSEHKHMRVPAPQLPAASIAAAERAFMLYPGLGHELFREQGWEKIVDDMIEFMTPSAAADTEAGTEAVARLAAWKAEPVAKPVQTSE